MIKKIPQSLYQKEYSDNISYYNFNNLIENYEAIFNISNFDVPEYSKTYFTNILETYASLFKKIKDAPLPNEELQKTVSSLKEMKIKDLSLIFILKDRKENDAIEIFSEIYRAGNYDNVNLFSLIKCLIKAEPFVTFSSHEFKNDHIHFYNAFNINNLEQIQFVENIQKINPDLSIASLYLVFFINKIITKDLKDNNIYPDDIGLKNLFYSNNSVELGDNILRKIDGENVELTNPFETLFLSWLEDTFVTNSNEPQSFELFDESKIEQKPYVITEPLIYFKLNSLKQFSDEFVNATVYTVNKQYTGENNLSYSANHVQKLTLLWDSKESTQERLGRLNNIFYYHFHPVYVNFYNSLFNLINFAQVENRCNKNLQNEMFDKNLIFVKNKTAQASSFNYTSKIDIKNINRYEPKKSLLNKTLQEANQEFVLKEFKVKTEHKGKKLLSVYDHFIVERFLDKALNLSQEQFLTDSCEYSYKTFVYQNNESEIENVQTSFNSNSSHITSSMTLNIQQKNALREICLEQGNKRLPVLFVPKMDNKSKKETIEIRNSTYKTLLNKKGVLIPVLLPIKILNELNEEEIVSCFTFFSYGSHISNYSFKSLNDLFLNGINQDYYDIGSRISIRNYSNELNVLNNLINTFFAYDSVFFKDKDLYLEKINKFYGGINCYADNNLNLIKESQSPFNSIRSAKQTVHLGKDYSNPIYAKVFAKVKVDEKLKLKYEKINKKYLKIESTYKEELEHIVDLTELIDHYQEKIKELTEKLAEKTEKRLECNEALKNTFQSFDFIRKTKDEIKEAYLNNYNENLKNGKLTINPYLFNSLSNNINVSYILFRNDCDQYLFYYNSKDRNTLYKVSETLHDKYYNEEEINNSSSYPFEDYQDVLPSILNGGYKIIKVCFTTVKPNLIKIDNTKNYVVGGPYRLIVTQDSLKVGLLNLSSIFGTRKHKSKIDEIKPHPHTSGINVYPHRNVHEYMYPQNACLGEATSLIYNAFNNNDLVKIIISTMIWVKSANSADYWGKTYNWFPKPETINCDFEELINLPSVTEIDSFIDTVLEEEPQQEESNEQTVSNEETVQPQTERNIEEYNTNQVYRRYIS